MERKLDRTASLREGLSLEGGGTMSVMFALGQGGRGLWGAFIGAASVWNTVGGGRNTVFGWVCMVMYVFNTTCAAI